MTDIKTDQLRRHLALLYLLATASVPCKIKENEGGADSVSTWVFSRLLCFNLLCVDILIVIIYNRIMRDASFFTKPAHGWQRRYEALRAYFVERLPAKIVAERFNLKPGYFRLLCHQFRTGKIDFAEPMPEGKSRRRAITGEVRKKIITWREQRLSAGNITELLSEEGAEISIRTVERVLAEEGFPKLPRRTRLKLGLTVKNAEVPKRADTVSLAGLEGGAWNCPAAGVFLFAPFLAQFDLDAIIREAGLPGSKLIPAKSYFLSFLALKLLGTERYSHVGDHTFDPGLGLFAGLGVLPKCTSLSTYAYRLDAGQLGRLQEAFVKNASALGLYKADIINLDFHTIPHFGDESVLEKHWAGARNKVMKGALTLFAQDADSKLILYTNADIQKEEADDQVLDFLAFWRGIHQGADPTFVFDSKFTTYAHLNELDIMGIKFITLRRRGEKLLKQVEQLSPWNRISVPHAKRKYPHPQVHDSLITLRGYESEIRQVVIRGNGREQPSFLISNDLVAPVELLVSNYARRWRVENGIAEAVKFFNLNALSSPILVKVHFDVLMTMVADTLYCMLAKKLRGFESCDAPKLYRDFVRTSGAVKVQNGEVTVTYSRRAHNPILRAVPWDNLPRTIPGLPGAQLNLVFR
jgi:transposase